MKTELTFSHTNAAEREVDAYPSLADVTRPNVSTAEAAFYLNRRPQTLRVWATYENGPIRPIRINGRLAWPVADLRRLARVEA